MDSGVSALKYTYQTSKRKVFFCYSVLVSHPLCMLSKKKKGNFFKMRHNDDRYFEYQERKFTEVLGI